jgi:hypothetical protein
MFAAETIDVIVEVSARSTAPTMGQEDKYE